MRHPLRRSISTLLCCSLLAASSTVLLPLSASANSNDSKDASATVFDARAAFEALKALEGEWSGTVTLDNGSEPRETSVVFEVSAAGHSVIETFAKGKPYEMFSVYHMDGDELLMTHYCAIGNAPKMKFVASDKPGELVFAFNGGSNLDPAKDAHAHEGRMQLMDAGSYSSWAVGWSGGKQSNVQHFQMTRAEPVDE